MLQKKNPKGVIAVEAMILRKARIRKSAGLQE